MNYKRLLLSSVLVGVFETVYPPPTPVYRSVMFESLLFICFSTGLRFLCLVKNLAMFLFVKNEAFWNWPWFFGPDDWSFKSRWVLKLKELCMGWWNKRNDSENFVQCEKWVLRARKYGFVFCFVLLSLFSAHFKEFSLGRRNSIFMVQKDSEKESQLQERWLLLIS